MHNMGRLLTEPHALSGGPIPAIGRAGIEQIDKVIDKGAYEGGGALTDVASAMGASPEVAAGAGMAGNMAVRGVPSLIGAGAGKAAETATKPLSRGLMQSALKPTSKDLASGDAAKAIDTMLEGGFSATSGGVAKMRSLVRKLSGEVDDLIDSSTGTVSRDAIRAEVIEQLKKFRNQVNPGADVKTILKSWDEFKHTVGSEIPVQKAQQLKQGTYKILADKYAHMGTVGDEAGTQAQMAMARGLRKGIEKDVPGVIPKNERMQELINAMEIAERRAGIAGNRDIAGIAWLAEHPAAAGGMIADRSPWIKSLLAKYLHSGMPLTGAGAGAAYTAEDEMTRRQR